MKVLVTKPFAYSATGLTVTHQFVAGDEPDVNESCVEGLIKEGFITVDLPPADIAKAAKEADAPQTVAALQEAVASITSIAADGMAVDAADYELGVVIPDNWRQIKWFGLKSLAQKIAGRDVVDSDDARAIIEAELLKRAG